MGVYKFIQESDKASLFKYIAIFVILLFLFKEKNIFFIIIFATVIISYSNKKSKNLSKNEQSLHETKINHLIPEPYEFYDKEDLIDFLFSIQDFYYYNPQAHREIIDNINSFFSIYNSDTEFCHYNYQIAESKKKNSLNSLHSLIHNLPDDQNVLDKFNRSHKRLNTIMTKYLNELYNKCHYDILKNGYNIYKKNINTGPTEANHYFDKDYTYQFY